MKQMSGWLLLPILLVTACAVGGGRSVRVEVGGELTALAEFDRHWDHGQPANTERIFRDFLDAAEREGESAIQAEILTQISRCQGLQGRFEDAHATLDAAALLIADSPGPAAVRLKLERGRALNSAGRAAEALPLFLAALNEAVEQGLEFHAVDAAHMLGIVEEPQRALEWNLEAIAMAEVAADPRARGWLGSLLNNTGWTYHDLGDHERALVLFEQALAFRIERKQAEQARIAKWCVARCRRSLGQFELALDLQRQLADEWRAAGGADGYVQEEQGELLLAMERPDEARPFFAEAYRLLASDPWLKAKEGGRLERLARLGGLD